MMCLGNTKWFGMVKTEVLKREIEEIRLMSDCEGVECLAKKSVLGRRYLWKKHFGKRMKDGLNKKGPERGRLVGGYRVISGRKYSKYFKNKQSQRQRRALMRPELRQWYLEGRISRAPWEMTGCRDERNSGGRGPTASQPAIYFCSAWGWW